MNDRELRPEITEKVARLEQAYIDIRVDLVRIEGHLTNHIPTSINDLNNKVTKLEIKMAYAAGIVTAILTIVQIIIRVLH